MKAILTLVMGTTIAVGCTSAVPASGGRPSTRVTAVAAENMWGDLLAQLGGDRVRVSNIIDDPGGDPHDYDPKASDSVAVADARLVVVNGVGYDGWASRLVAANPSAHRVVIDVGRVVGAAQGDNPHRWYVPADVHRVVQEMAHGLQRVDPDDRAYFEGQLARLESAGLKGYDDQVARIRATSAGRPIAITESVFTGMAEALGLQVRTPPSFAQAVAEGNEPTARDKATTDEQIARHQVDVVVYNSQNATPDVRALTDTATKAAIPVVAVTETLSPRRVTFQDWQQRQLSDLESALARAPGPGQPTGPVAPPLPGPGR